MANPKEQSAAMQGWKRNLLLGLIVIVALYGGGTVVWVLLGSVWTTDGWNIWYVQTTPTNLWRHLELPMAEWSIGVGGTLAAALMWAGGRIAKKLRRAFRRTPTA